jgi:flagellar hook protein FlgE
MPLFSIPLSGLTASSTAMSTIANNLANLNTVGYKGSHTQFRDLFYQTVGSNGAGDPVQVGAGTAVSATATNLTAGSIESTGVPTDVAIMGDGYFVLEHDGASRYTRGGNFTVTPDGSLCTQDGDPVMGYMAVNGLIPQGAALTPLRIDKGQINPPHATGDIRLRTNLDASAAVGAVYSTPVTVYDSLGTPHVLQFNFSKTGANAWSYNLSLNTADLAAPANWAASQPYAAGNLVAPGNGHYYQCTVAGTSGASAPTWPTDGGTVSDGGAAWTDLGTTMPSDSTTAITGGALAFDASGKLISPPANLTGITSPVLADGASPMNFDWTLFDSGNVSFLSQVASASTTSSKQQDGYGSGTLTEYNAGADGILMGSFSNGRTAALGQIALASFANLQGLQREGGNSYSATLASGAAVIGIPNSGGRGSLSGGSLELSNVDIAQEFSALIVAQRGYEANARTITTFDQIMQDTINLKQA